MKDNSKYGYLAKNTMLFAINSFGSKILVFLLVPLYTSVLTTNEYGIADIVSTSATLLTYIFSINIADAVLRFAIEEGSDHNRILAYGIRVHIIGSCLLGTILFLTWIFGLVKWPRYCYVFLFLIYFSYSIHLILNNYLRAIDKVKEVAISGLITTLATAVSNIILLLVYDLRLIGYLLSIFVGLTLSSVYCLVVFKPSLRTWGLDCCDPAIRREMRQYSIPLIFNSIAWWMNSSIDKYFVIFMCGASVNGLVSVAYKIPTILSVFHRIFSQAWNLSAIKEYDKDDSDGFFTKIYSAYNAGLVILCSALILANIPIARLLFAKDFFVAWQYSSILLLSTLFSCLSGILGSVFTAVKNSKIFAYSTVTSAVVNCVLNITLIHFFGAIGAVVATAFSFVCVWGIRLICVQKYLSLRINVNRDFFAYVLLVIQVIFEHFESHFYIGQTVVLLGLLVLYRQFIFNILNVVKRRVCIYIRRKLWNRN